MLGRTNTGGGGTSLNFKVVGNPQPENPKENTIWINTDDTVTSWVFSPAQPVTVVEGMVWIKTGLSSPTAFNALQKNGLTVCPMSAMQYLEGAWAEKQAKSYQGGAWVSWIPAGALYYFGNDCAATSGGWQARGWKYQSKYDEIIPTIVNRDDHMEITVPSGQVVSGAVEIKTDQDFTNISGITIDFEGKINSFLPMLMVIDRNATYMENAVRWVNIAGDRVNTGTFTRRTVTLDTSGLTGLYDVAIGFADAWAGAASDGVYMKVYSVMMEHAELPPGGSGVSASHDGQGNVYLSGVSAVNDGSGNVAVG